MAEILSIASGVAGLLTFGTTVLAAGFEYMRSVSSVPEDFRSLILEANVFNNLLTQIISTLLNGEDHKFPLGKAIEESANLLHDIQALVQEFESLSEPYKMYVINTPLWSGKRKKISEYRGRLSRLCATFRVAISMENMEMLHKIERRQNESNTVIEHSIQGVEKILEQKILDWLSPRENFDPSVKQAAISSLRQPGTNEWLFREQSFRDWLSQGRFLWLNGSSGSVKTVLVSSIIDHLKTSYICDEGPTPVVAHHYCEFSNPFTLDPLKITGSLLRQLSLQVESLSPSLRHLYHESSGQYPHLHTLYEVLKDGVAQTDHPVFLIIDGLDECPRLNRKVFLKELRQFCTELRKELSIKVLLSSRPEADIRQILLYIPSFSVEHRHVKLDIGIHVKSEIRKLPILRVLNEEDLISDLVNRADGMFRWVQCQLESLRKLRTRQALRQALRTLPTGLEETYDRVLMEIDLNDHEYVLRMLHWLIASEHPLSTTELAEAIAINPEKGRLDPDERLLQPREFFESFGSLIRIEQNQTVVLAHFSVKEYLLSSRLIGKSQPLAKFALRPANSSQHVSMCTLSYVLSVGTRIKALQESALDESEFPLISHVVSLDLNRFQHFDAIDSWMRKNFLRGTTTKVDWLRLLDYTSPPAGIKANHAVGLRIKRFLRCALMYFWDRHSYPDTTIRDTSSTALVKKVSDIFLDLQRSWESAMLAHADFRHNMLTASPLCTATALDYRGSMRALLQNGTLVDGIASVHFAGNPLLVAAIRGNEEAVRLLLRFGANINIESPCAPYTTMLTAGASSNLRIFEYLVQELKLDTNGVDIWGRTIHYWARHDTKISRTLRPYLPTLESLRTSEVDMLETKRLYSTILELLQGAYLEDFSALREYHDYETLSFCLFKCGPDFHDYAAAFFEHDLARSDNVVHISRCDDCSEARMGPSIRGSCFLCLDCLGRCLCSDCHSIWQENDKDTTHCKAHSFYELPRPCWYHFEEGIVMEDGSTFPEIIDHLTERFTTLLQIENGPS